MMKNMESIEQIKNRLQQKVAYPFKNRELLLIAFTHKSFFHENKKMVLEHNERMEFLGDAVLDLLAGEFLYRQYPLATEGELSQIRSFLVDTSACIMYLKKLGVEQWILLGKGEKKLEQRGNQTIYSGTFEALLGAIFLDGGFSAVRTYFLDNFSQAMTQLLEQPIKNYKALLQEYVQKKEHIAPHYLFMEEKGPEHDKSFCMAVF